MFATTPATWTVVGVGHVPFRASRALEHVVGRPTFALPAFALGSATPARHPDAMPRAACWEWNGCHLHRGGGRATRRQRTCVVPASTANPTGLPRGGRAVANTAMYPRVMPSLSHKPTLVHSFQRLLQLPAIANRHVVNRENGRRNQSKNNETPLRQRHRICQFPPKGV
eukprot:gene17902-biopygen12923